MALEMAPRMSLAGVFPRGRPSVEDVSIGVGARIRRIKRQASSLPQLTEPLSRSTRNMQWRPMKLGSCGLIADKVVTCARSESAS